jgi:hypothetical protein
MPFVPKFQTSENTQHIMISPSSIIVSRNAWKHVNTITDPRDALLWQTIQHTIILVA